VVYVQADSQPKHSLVELILNRGFIRLLRQQSHLADRQVRLPSHQLQAPSFSHFAQL